MTETQTLEALLRRWSELEPDRCIIYPNDLAINVRRLDRWPHVGFMGGDIDEDHIQAATQEAIEARGWSWSVWHNFTEGTGGASHYSAFVDILDGEAVKAGDIECSDTPAAALLSAYLQALESIA